MKYDLREEGIDIRWKPTQMMESNAEMTFMAVPDQLCSQGLEQVYLHYLKKGENKLCTDCIQSMEFYDEPLPKMSIYFKKNVEKDLPADVAKKLVINSKSYKKKDGVRLLTIECAPQDVGRIGMAATYLQKSGQFKKLICRQGHMKKTPPGKASVADLISCQAG